jgi:hypothetical protein
LGFGRWGLGSASEAPRVGCVSASLSRRKGLSADSQLEATFFAEYLLEHLKEFQAELKDYMAVPWPDPPSDAI